jgi:hypothetical protein
MQQYASGNYKSQQINWMLKKRIEVVPDENSIVPVSQRVWRLKHHYLDFTLKTSDRVGLDAWIPHVDTSHNWVMQFDTTQPFRCFKAKRGDLGFNRKGSMLWCGRAPSGEDLYLCFVDKTYLKSSSGKTDDDPKARSPLASHHYHMILHFLAAMIEENPDKAVLPFERYPDDPSKFRDNICGM